MTHDLPMTDPQMIGMMRAVATLSARDLPAGISVLLDTGPGVIKVAHHLAQLAQA
jgi:hypothetical protein